MIDGKVLPNFYLIFSILLTLFCAEFAAAQDSDSLDVEWNIRPTLSVGVGMMNYQGDLIGTKGYFNPFQNKTAVHVNAAQPVTSFLDLNLYMMYGSLGADERTLVRNLNFKSRITAGGVSASYNFDHLLKPDRVLEPFVSLGFEAFEFQSKTDLIDANGNPYHYWSDGTIRNLPEQTENLGTAIEITRDYSYETDIRDLNRDGFGDYSQRSFAIPFGAGFNFILNEKIDFKMGLEYHWTFTDYIDGITFNSRGNRSGNKQNDNFMHTFMRLSYDLTPTPHEPSDAFAGKDKVDTDLDSIPDFLDDCPQTPTGVQVNDRGCPLDTDGDGVFDYVDSELNSPEGAIVDSSGVALSDADFERMYLEFTDKSGKYSTYSNESYSLETVERKTKRRAAEFAVKIGEVEGPINDSLANELLSMPDVSFRQENGKTIIEVANINDLPTAVQKKIELESKGIQTSSVVETTASGKKSTVTQIEQDAYTTKTYGAPIAEIIEKNKSLPKSKKLIVNREEYTLDRPIDQRSVAKANDETFGDNTVYRVQVGAFANRLSEDVFKNVKDLLVITTADGLTRYYVGAFTNYEQAAARKIDMIEKGFDGSHVVPFKQGQKVSLQDAGAIPAENVVPLENTQSANFGKVKFKVQIGSFEGQIPTDMLDKMMDLGRIDQRKKDDGQTLYLTGEFNNVDEANALKEHLISQGFEAPIVVADFNGNIISAEEGLELIK